MHAAVAAGAHRDITAAASVMASIQRDVWKPDEHRADAYERLFAVYLQLHERFGREPSLMHELRDLRRQALSQ